MGLLESFQNWRAERYERHIAKMREENKCPDCRGRGYQIYPVNEFMYIDQSFDCPGCDGSGLFSDWSGQM